MKNIALIINSLQGGGAERCAADLSIIFSNRGYNVFIITEKSAGIKYEFNGKIVNYVFSYAENGDSSEKNFLMYKINELKAIKKKYDVDVSISFMQFANYLNILSKEDEKVILTTHSLNSEYAKVQKENCWSKETFMELYQFADLITFPSEYCKKDWIAHYGDKNQITKTVYNPVHLMDVEVKEPKENVVISIGRMEGVKRQWHLLRVFKKVKELCPNSKLIILGDGVLRTKMAEMVENLGLEDSVEMPGNVQNVHDYLAKAKVFTLTSRFEAMSCSVLEALSAEVPVVAFDIPGGIREELEIEKDTVEYPMIGENGIVTPYFKEYIGEELSCEEEILAKEIVHLLEDENLRTKMIVNAKRNIRKFTPEEIGRIWIEDVFKNHLNRKINQEEFIKVRDKHFKKFSIRSSNNNMYVSYYRLLEKWMILKEKGINVKTYFEKKEMKDIIIYGFGKMANHLISDLKNSDIKIKCIIDKAAFYKYGEFPLITGEDGIPQADCIVVTPIYQFDMIKSELESKTINRIVSLDEIIDDVLKEQTN